MCPFNDDWFVCVGMAQARQVPGPSAVAQQILPPMSGGQPHPNPHIKYGDIGGNAGSGPSPAGLSVPHSAHSFVPPFHNHLQHGGSALDGRQLPLAALKPPAPQNAPNMWGIRGSEPPLLGRPEPLLLDAPIETGDLLAILANAGVHDPGLAITGGQDSGPQRGVAPTSGPLIGAGQGRNGPPMYPMTSSHPPAPGVQFRTPAAPPELAGTDISTDFLSLLGELRR
jgi:hypothetical protein